MSAQIDKLIANIQDKFDNEFNQKLSSNQGQPTITQTQQSKNDVVNPEICESKVDQNPANNSQNTTANKKQFMKKQIKIIEQATPIKNKKKQNSAHIQHGDLTQNERDQQKDQNIYKSLSNKLQTALKKITISNPQAKKFNKNKTRNILQRFDDHQKNKQKQLQQKRLIQQQKKYFGLKQKPDIDPNSRRIATEISYKPIYQRFQQILQQRKRRHQQNQQTKKAKKQQEYEQYLAEYQSHVKIQPEDCRDSQTYFNDMMQWKKKLQKQKQQKQKQKEEKSTQGYTFKPLLNQKSMKMLQNKKRICIQDREIQKSYSHHIWFPFKPNVNKRVQKQK